MAGNYIPPLVSVDTSVWVFVLLEGSLLSFLDENTDLKVPKSPFFCGLGELFLDSALSDVSSSHEISQKILYLGELVVTGELALTFFSFLLDFAGASPGIRICFPSNQNYFG